MINFKNLLSKFLILFFILTLAAGCLRSGSGADGDMNLIKTNTSATETWSKTFGGNGFESGHSVFQTTDGGYILLGITNSYGAGDVDMYLLKTDSNGNETWSKTFGGNGFESGNSVFQTTDGGYILLGDTHSYGAGNSDMYLLKTDSNGNETWSKTFGESDFEWGSSVQQTTDGGYILLGETDSYGAGDTDIYLLKTDSNGNETWSRTFGGNGYERGHSVFQTTDGGYILLGETDSYGAGNSDMYLVKTDVDGNVAP